MTITNSCNYIYWIYNKGLSILLIVIYPLVIKRGNGKSGTQELEKLLN